MHTAWYMKGGVTVEYLENLPLSELNRKLDIINKIADTQLKQVNAQQNVF
jgi:hypothetical protein